ncbi:universal stress protein [Siccirubricoccus sp. KC 17139]|uniref:Universal stress protein n=1 Tax=Siccirubricoccus soli TaxID=2899147 RepID=A0ABT1D1X3_9PROT|nr:universal stress protein [Siccirubricoccus soli]MCO6415914.1 universal stress protein [Siccirubricoccus soli]MCP2682046.1 universal stress protein [Siccirubricoccus soli]
MSLKDLLVHLDATERSAARLQFAADLARRHGAHLTGLFVVDAVLPALAAADAGGVAAVGVIDALREEGLAAAAKAEAAFRACLRREDLPGEWRQAEGSIAEVVTQHARYADLTILGQASPDGMPPGAGTVIEQVLFGAGRPVLVVPYADSFGVPGERALIGWNASREAARAVRDALPLLVGAGTATVLVVSPGGAAGVHGEDPGADIARHLARHGVAVRVERSSGTEISVADILLNHAAELQADLLVIGGYGHSRLREWALGGVTRRLLQEMTLPVLLSH